MPIMLVGLKGKSATKRIVQLHEIMPEVFRLPQT
jgi:hypothetical protein